MINHFNFNFRIVSFQGFPVHFAICTNHTISQAGQRCFESYFYDMKIHPRKDFWKNNLKKCNRWMEEKKKAEKPFSRYVTLLFHVIVSEANYESDCLRNIKQIWGILCSRLKMKNEFSFIFNEDIPATSSNGKDSFLWRKSFCWNSVSKLYRLELNLWYC